MAYIGQLPNVPPEQWRVFDNEDQAKIWNDANTSGLVWEVDLEP